MTPLTFLGIDPGVSGGLATLGPLDSVAMPPTEKDIYDWLEDRTSDGETVAVLEKVGGFIPNSGGNVGSRMFKFGQSYGFLRGCLTALEIPFQEVTPAVWQRALGVPVVKGEAKGARKNRLKALAQRLFPQGRVTLATADALLLAEYCRRWHNGLLPTQGDGAGKGGQPLTGVLD